MSTASGGTEGGIHRVVMRHGDDAHALAVLRVTTGSGLAVDVLPDRCLDLGPATYRGLAVAWMGGQPPRHPADLPENTWRARFVGGLLATCGLDNVGPACEDEGTYFPQHGRIAGEPARGARWGTRRVGRRSVYWLSAEVAQPDSTLRLRRRILIPDHTPMVRVRDEVRNTGTRPEPLMIQYHCNFGAPFVAPGGQVVIPNTTVTPRDASAAAALDRWQRIEPPRGDEVERVFRHEQRGERRSTAYLVPPEDGPVADYRVLLRADRRTLPWLWQWRLLAPETYVIGLEPANCAVKPRDAARACGALPLLGPGEHIRFVVEIAISPRDRPGAQDG